MGPAWRLSMAKQSTGWLDKLFERMWAECQPTGMSLGGNLLATEKHERPFAVAGGVGGDRAKDEVPDHALPMMQQQHALGLNILRLLADVWPNIHCHVHGLCAARCTMSHTCHVWPQICILTMLGASLSLGSTCANWCSRPCLSERFTFLTLDEAWGHPAAEVRQQSFQSRYTLGSTGPYITFQHGACIQPA